MKTIDDSLNLKIKENDEKIKALFTRIIPKKPINNNYKTKINYNNSNHLSKYPKENIDKPALQTQYKKLRLLQKTVTTKDLTNLGTNPRNTFLSMSSLNSLNTINNNKKTPIKMKPKPKLKPKITNTAKKPLIKKFNNHIATNSINNKTRSKIDTARQMKKTKHKVNLTEMFDRFELDQIKKNEKIEKMKKQKEEQELKLCSHKPILNKKTEEIVKDDISNFLIRQEILEEMKKEKDEKLKETLFQNEQEKIMKSSYIYQKRLENLNKNGMNNSTLSDLSSITRSQKEINEGINRLFEWDEQRKYKLEQLMTEKSLFEISGHIPIINERSASLANNKNKEIKFYERLSKEDTLLRAKKALLAKALAPSFKPNLFLTKNYGKGVKDEKSEKSSPDKRNRYNTSTHYNSSEHLMKKERKNNKKKEIDDTKIIVNKILQSDARKRLSISNLNINRSEFQRVMRNIVIKNMEKKAKPIRRITRSSLFNV